MLNNAITPLEERAEQGVRPQPTCQNVHVEGETIEAQPVRLASVPSMDWKQAQKEDPILYQVVKHLRAPKEDFRKALKTVAEKKTVLAFLKARNYLIMRDGLLYHKKTMGPVNEVIFCFVVPSSHRRVAVDGCHRDAAHQGECRCTLLMQERFWWPGMTRDLRHCIKHCGRCRGYEDTTPVAPLKPLACSGPGELLHIDYTSIEETISLQEKPVIRNVLVLQDHFSKYVVAYVVKTRLRVQLLRLSGKGILACSGCPPTLSVIKEGPLLAMSSKISVSCMACTSFGRRLIMPRPTVRWNG